MQKNEELNPVEVMLECSDLANRLKDNVSDLEVIRSVISTLMVQLMGTDSSMFEGVSQLVFQDIKRQIRLIDMALCPLVDEMEKGSLELSENVANIHRQLADEYEKK